MRSLSLTLPVLLLAVFACGGKDTTSFDPAAGVWAFSLSNPLPVIPNLKAPDDLPLSLRLRKEVFSPGDVLRVVGDSIKVENGRYEEVDMPLVLLPALVPPRTAESDFAERINSGRVLADATYPRVDSADVSYSYQKDYRGIEYDELSELEFSAEPGGEFIVVVRDRLLMNQQWRLSADGRYLILLDRKNGSAYRHYPVLAYTDEYIDLRMPLTVKTREPRGVKLESHAEIDAFIRITRRTDATSPRRFPVNGG